MEKNMQSNLIGDEILEYDAQFADNINEEDIDETDEIKYEFKNKRKMLEKTKIVKQTWSIIEIYQKIDSGNLILNPDYQRNEVWHVSKQISFIESLFMQIMIPPIYVVEVPGNNILEQKKYEVVDGKQRLTTIRNFMNDTLILDKKFLEYYSDLYDGKNFSKITEEYSEKVNEVLSSILDIYVITSNSPAETKYDIFARLNKGAEPLKVNEIRKAIYHSKVTQIIDIFINEKIEDKDNMNNDYLNIFSSTDIKRFNDYGRFYRSIAFFYNTDINLCTVNNYKSRPKQMIDEILQCFQIKGKDLDDKTIKIVLDKTIELMKIFKDDSNREYLVDACIPFSLEYWDDLMNNINNIIENEEIKKTFIKSKATTSNVNKRVEVIKKLLKGC